MLRAYYDSDYENVYYDISEIKSILNYPSVNKKNYFEESLKDSNVPIYDWIMEGTDYRMILKEDLHTFLIYYQDNLTDKLKLKHEVPDNLWIYCYTEKESDI